MAGEVATAPPTVQEEFSLQQQLEQIEAAVSEAHGIVDKIIGHPPEEPEGGNAAVEASAEASGHRTIADLQNLIGRLNEISRRVGRL